MQASAQPAPVSKKMLWAGYIISALPALMMICASAVPKFIMPAGVIELFARLGYAENIILGIGILSKHRSRFSIHEETKNTKKTEKIGFKPPFALFVSSWFEPTVCSKEVG